MKVEIVSKLKEECRSTKFLVEQVQKVTSWLCFKTLFLLMNHRFKLTIALQN